MQLKIQVSEKIPTILKYQNKIILPGKNTEIIKSIYSENLKSALNQLLEGGEKNTQ